MEQLNIEGKRSGDGFVAHKAVLLEALQRTTADRIILCGVEVGRRGLLNYFKALAGSNIIKVVPAKGNEWLLTRWLSQKTNPEIAWKPSNPYDFITGAIEVSEWKFILRSTHNVRFALASGIIGWFIYWLTLRTYDRKKKGVRDVPKNKA